MSDVMSPAQRRKAMRSNRGRTGPERRFASGLWRMGLRYLTGDGYARRYELRLVGNPDLVFPRRRLVVFVDGCFWHGCKECGRVTPNMSKFWTTKIATNVARDERITKNLSDAGWQVLRVWEHSVRTVGERREVAERIARLVRLHSVGSKIA